MNNLVEEIDANPSALQISNWNWHMDSWIPNATFEPFLLNKFTDKNKNNSPFSYENVKLNQFTFATCQCFW